MARRKRSGTRPKGRGGLHLTRRQASSSDEHLGDGVPLKNTILVHGYWAHRWKRLDPHPAPLVRVQVRVKAHLKGEGPMKDNERVWELRR